MGLKEGTPAPGGERHTRKAGKGYVLVDETGREISLQRNREAGGWGYWTTDSYTDGWSQKSRPKWVQVDVSSAQGESRQNQPVGRQQPASKPARQGYFSFSHAIDEWEKRKDD